MAKHRKTRKEKIVSDNRQPTLSQEVVVNQTKSSPFTFSQAEVPSTPTTQIQQFGSLRKDLVKTTVLTLSIILVELILVLIIKI